MAQFFEENRGVFTESLVFGGRIERWLVTRDMKGGTFSSQSER